MKQARRVQIFLKGALMNQAVEAGVAGAIEISVVVVKPAHQLL